MKSFDVLKMCLNPKVIGVLALVAGLVLIFDSSLFVRVLPLLFLAACPLSMLLMAVMMRGHHESGTPRASSETAEEIARLRSEVETLRGQVAAPDAATPEVKASSP